MLKYLNILLKGFLIVQPLKWNSLEWILQANFNGRILMRRKLLFIFLVTDPWPEFFSPPSPPPPHFLERAQTRKGACLSLKRLFVSMVTCLPYLQSCKLGNSIKGLSRQFLLKWCLILAVCFIYLCCPITFWIWWLLLSNGGSKITQYEADYSMSDWDHWALFLGTVVGCQMVPRGWLCDLCAPDPPLHWTPAAEPSIQAELLGDALWGQLEKK